MVMKGFGSAIIIIVVAAIVALGGWWYWSQQQEGGAPAVNENSQVEPVETGSQATGGGSGTTGTVTLGTSGNAAVNTNVSNIVSASTADSNQVTADDGTGTATQINNALNNQTVYAE